MLPRLRLRKIRRRLISNRKGFSSIVGAVFAVLVMFSLISTVFVFSLSQNTLYNNSVRQSNLADLDRSNEKIVTNVTCSRIDNSTVSVNGSLENDGPLSVHILTLWVVNANNTKYAYQTPLNITLPPGNITTLSGSTGIIVPLSNSATDSLSCWFMSERGNTISRNGGAGYTVINNNSYTTLTGNNNTINYPTQIVNSTFNNATVNNSTITNSTIVTLSNNSMVSQGIGSIAMNFSAFWHYDFTSTPASGTLLPSKSKANYTVSEGNYTLFHVMLADYDPLGQNIVLDQNSSIYIVGQHSGTVKYANWNLVNVTGGKIYPSASGFKVNLLLGVQTELYFAGSISSIDTGSVYPLNIMTFGKKGNDDYGQNIPFVSIYLVG